MRERAGRKLDGGRGRVAEPEVCQGLGGDVKRAQEGIEHVVVSCSLEDVGGAV